MKKIILAFLMGVLPCGLVVAKDYDVDTAHSQVEFKVKHNTVSNVSGSFDKFSGTLSIDNDKLTALMGEIDVDTINTKSEERDKHIKEQEYFDVEKFPKATLKFVSISGNEGVFDLTIKGVTKQVMLNVELGGIAKNKSGVEIVGLSLDGKINRKDFGIAESTPNIFLGEEVAISIGIEGIEAK